MFSLSKWYGDCIGDNGDAVIAYNAKLRWGTISLNYGSLLDHRTGERQEVSFTLSREGAPRVDGEHCHWTSGSLRFNGIWRSLAPPIADVIYRSAEGIVEWWCGWPSAHARIRIRGKQPLEGCGYVEHLHLTIPPWKLPIRRLRWGHFAGGQSYAVWIDWHDDFSKAIVFVDGLRQSAPTIRNESVEVNDDGCIHLDRSHCLRDGKIGATALGIVRRAADIFPASILAVTETKWRSRAVLRRPGMPDVEGWAIHEEVVWPEARDRLIT